jgi:putative endonuclease
MAYYIYITTNPAKAVLYIGVTNSLPRRLGQHYENRGNNDTFAGRYFCYNLLYYEQFTDIKAAISREKELKGWTRAKKDALIATMNPAWDFLML